MVIFHVPMQMKPQIAICFIVKVIFKKSKVYKYFQLDISLSPIYSFDKNALSNFCSPLLHVVLFGMVLMRVRVINAALVSTPYLEIIFAKNIFS